LLIEILCDDYEKKICKNINKSLAYIYTNILTERQQEIIQFRFIKKKSLLETGNNIGLTKEGTRQAEIRLLKLYQKPYVLSFITDGIEKTIKKQDKKIDLAIQYQKEINKHKHSTPKELPIYYLDLPLKTLNYLIKELSYMCSPANLKIKHIIKLGPDGLANINGIGTSTYKTIVDAMTKSGVNTQKFQEQKLYKSC
jgi:hypothetical protein